jgi:hypothetical protein
MNNVILDINDNLNDNCCYVNSFKEILEHYNDININKTLKIVHQNIRSARKNFDNFLSHIIKNIDEIDVIVLTEIYIYQKELKFYNIEGFHLFAKPREFNRGGGIIIYVKNDLKINEINIELLSTESLILNLNNCVNIVALYRPPSNCKKTFLDELKNKILKNKELNNTIIIGDININILDNDDRDCEKYVDILAKSGFECNINLPTREEVNKEGVLSSTCIDHIYSKVNANCAIDKSFIITHKITDHYMIVACVLLPKKIISNKYIYKLDLKKYANYIKKFDWTKFLQCNDVNELYNNIVDVFESAKKTYTFRVLDDSIVKRVNKLWINDEIILLIKLRDRAFKRHKSNLSNSNYDNYYKKLRNAVNFKIKDEKIKYYKKLFNDCLGNIIETWCNINKIFGKRKSNIDETISRFMSDKYSNKEIVENFCNTFVLGVKRIMHNCDIQVCENIDTGVQLQSIYIPSIHDAVTEKIIKTF